MAVKAGAGMPIGWTVLLPVTSGRGSGAVWPPARTVREGTGMGPKIAIIGGGIGGLTAAVALARKGLAAEVFEQAPVLEEVGAGVGWLARWRSWR
jgi:NADPH-dependent 2,4-dienoyl-CoA reductase/sulfur reductase-like enzyme